MASPSTGYFPLTGDSFIDSITNGYRWNLDGSKTVDYSISGGFAGEYWNAPATVAQYMGAALDTFSYYANIKFNYVGSFSTPITAGQAGSEINLSLDGVNRYFSSINQWAVGFFPSPSYGTYQAGDIFLNLLSAANTLPSYEPGSQGWFLLIHELGHTLGLKHPHDNGGTNRPTFSSLGIGALDIDWASVMSYNDNATWNKFSWDPATPMLLDVLGLMYLYGKNTATNAGDSVFTLKEWNTYLTVWDASGIDTLDASTAASGWTVYMPDSAISTLVNEKVGYAMPTSQLTSSSPTTLEWLLGEFENLVGSNYADHLYGNSLGNRFSGGLGNDYIDGSGGVDYVVYSSSRALYTITYSSVNNLYTIQAPSYAGGTDTVTNVEYAIFSDGTYSLSSLVADTTAPTISLSASDTNLTKGITSTITFLLSEESVNFTISDVSVSGGALSNFSGTGLRYSATFTPALNSTTSGSISVSSNTFSDAAGNFNQDGGDANNRVSIVINTLSPSYLMLPSSLTMNEGATNSITLQTINLTAGSTLTYAISGIAASRLSSGVLSGTLTIDSTGKAIIPFSVLNDNFTNGVTTASFTVGANLASTSITINDTSLTPGSSQVTITANNPYYVSTRDLVVTGSSGTDKVIYAASSANFTITATDTRATVKDNAGTLGTSTLTNVERLKFSDINVALDTARGDNAGKAYRIYKAAFNRTPDTEGLGFWIASLDSGNSLNNASQGFIGSPEFQRMYGTNSSDTTFLNNIYTNVLGRNYDQSGYDFWLNGLKNGLQRDSLLSQFSESVENCANVAPLIGQGIAYKEYVG